MSKKSCTDACYCLAKELQPACLAQCAASGQCSVKPQPKVNVEKSGNGKSSCSKSMCRA